MALLVMDGFEAAPAWRAAYQLSTSAIAFPGRDGVGKSIQPAGVLHVSPPTPVATLILGCGAWWSTNSNNVFVVCGDANSTVHLLLGVDGTGRFVVTRSPSTVLATGTTALGQSTWHWIEVKATIADAGGTVIVKVDGVEEINFTGDTKNAGTLTTISTVRLTGGGNLRYDDLVLCDATGSAPFNDFFGEKVIKAKTLNGNGATSQWVGSDGNSTDNYQLVDEIPVSATDYSASSTAGDRDLYTLTNATGLATVNAVQVSSYIAKSDAGPRSFKTLTRNAGGVVTSGPTTPLSTTYQLLAGGIEQTDPSAAAWTTTNVNTIQAGVECV